MSFSARLDALRPSARKVALLVLMETEKGAPLQAALSSALNRTPLSKDARRQATDLAYCCLRAYVRCLFVLKGVYPKFDRFPKPVQYLLLTACTALLFQDGAPAYAVVNETVSDIRFLAGKGIAGAANGGLRSLLRSGDAVQSQDFYRREGEGEFDSFCRYTSFPPALGKLLLKECGEEKARAVMQASFLRPLACIRLNPQKAGCNEIREMLLGKNAEPLPGDAGQYGLYFPNGVPADVSLSALALEGRLSFQAAGSQLAMASLSIDRESPIWDACAGFGGKTALLLERGYQAELASDVSWQRIREIPGECARLGLKKPALMLCDGSKAPLMRWDGTMILDVPCSGLGVLSRRPDIKIRQRDIASYVRTQKALLERALLMVPKGRDIIYMTCTVTKSENSALVREACHSFGVSLEEEHTVEQPFEGMYACRIRA